jgi:hypothetical protein
VAQHKKQFEEAVLRIKDLSQINQGSLAELRRSLEVQRGNDMAYFDERIIVGIAQGGDGLNALAAQVTALGLVVSDPLTGVAATAASLASTILTVTGQGVTLTAHGALLNAIDVTLGGVSAGAKFFAETKVTAAGFDASIGIGAYGSDGVTKGASAIIADAKNDGTGRVRLIADKIVFADTGGNIYALFEASGAYINKARIVGLTATNIDVTNLFAQTVAVGGTLTVGASITISGPNGRIVVSD